MASDNDNHDKTVVVVTEKIPTKKSTVRLAPCLIQLSGREAGHTYDVSNQTLKIGRDPNCEIVLDDPHISRIHAEIIYEDEKNIRLCDRGSTNGVFVNGTRITDVVLSDGDKILVGTRLHFKFCYQDAVDQDYQQNLFQAANIDNLTRLYNKRFLVHALTKEFSYSRRNKQALSLLMIDVDHFKKVNDTYGHLAGDEVLRSLGEYFQKYIRLENFVCRYGGEEFVLVLRNTPQQVAYTVAERIRQAIHEKPILFSGQSITITVSIGIATYVGDNFETIFDFIQHADENLYEAKEKGRNVVMMRKAA